MLVSAGFTISVIGTVLSAQYYVRVLPLLLAYVYGIPVDDMLEWIG